MDGTQVPVSATADLVAYNDNLRLAIAAAKAQNEEHLALSHDEIQAQKLLEESVRLEQQLRDEQQKASGSGAQLTGIAAMRAYAATEAMVEGADIPLDIPAEYEIPPTTDPVVDPIVPTDPPVDPAPVVDSIPEFDAPEVNS